MKECCIILLIGAVACTAGEPPQLSTDQSSGTVAFADMVRSLHDRGFTNISETDLRRDAAIWLTNMFRVHAALPLLLADWPPPETVDTSRMNSILRFIEEHGWSMDQREHFMMPATRGLELSGLPWREIAHLKYRAVTREGILYVTLAGFGPESDGVAWNPNTNRFDTMISGFGPLGGGWYYWKQTAAPAGLGNRVYEGGARTNGQPDGPANGSQPIRSEPNTTSPGAGSRR